MPGITEHCQCWNVCEAPAAATGDDTAACDVLNRTAAAVAAGSLSVPCCCCWAPGTSLHTMVLHLKDSSGRLVAVLDDSSKKLGYYAPDNG